MQYQQNLSGHLVSHNVEREDVPVLLHHPKHL